MEKLLPLHICYTEVGKSFLVWEKCIREKFLFPWQNIFPCQKAKTRMNFIKVEFVTKSINFATWIFLVFGSRASRIYVNPSCHKFSIGKCLLAFHRSLIPLYTLEQPPLGNCLGWPKSQVWGPLDPARPPGPKNICCTPDFRPSSAWEAPTVSWRTLARTSPGINFLGMLLKQRLFSM